MRLTIGHLYPNLMNIYGDRGNIITLVNRCLWRGIDVEVREISLGVPIDTEIDLFFFGGGQDKEQVLVAGDLKGDKGRALIDAVENGAALLSICGGYQLLGQYYRPHLGEDLPGIGLFDAYTVAGEKRMIGNVVIEITKDYLPQYKKISLELPKWVARVGGIPTAHNPEHARESTGGKETRDRTHEETTHRYSNGTSQYNIKTLVGFENHSGKTYLGKNCQPLGRVLIGFGNNGEDRQEGATYKNAFGCYLHGPILPKNPHFADYLIQQALRRKTSDFQLPPLDDSLEYRAHQSAISRARTKP